MQNLMLKNGISLLKTNFNLSIRSPVCLSILYLALLPVSRSISNLNTVRAAECLEQSVALIGIFLFVPLSRPEQHRNIREILFSKKKSYRWILFLRLCMAVCCLLLLLSLFLAAMITLGCSFPFGAYMIGTSASSLALGSLGFFGASCTKNVITGYLLSVGYFTLNLLGVIRENSCFFLFFMSNGIENTKYWLLAISVFCFFIGIFFSIKRKKSSSYYTIL